MKRVCVLVTLIAAAGSAACRKQEAPSSPGVSTVEPANTNANAKSAPDPWQKPEAKTDPLAHPLFWSVEKAGKTTYFLGTMHIGVDASSRLPALVWQRLDAAKTFAMEADLDDQSADLMTRKGGSLRSDLGEEYWTKLEAALGPVTAGQADHMKAMFAAANLSLRGLPITLPMDMVLSARATTEHKTIVFLEPTATQLAILDKWLDVKALKMMLDELPDAEKHSKDMLDAYIAGDEHKIEALSDSEKDDALKHGYTAADYDQEMNEMLYDRNASWIDAIEKVHAEGGGFVAVGAMHLVGKRSVLDLLAHKGYKVTRLAP